MYNRSVSFVSGEVSLVMFWRYSLRELKASLCCSPHSNFWELRRTLKNGKLQFAERGINLFRAAILPVSFCKSLIDCGSSMLQRAAIFSRLASMPLVETRHPKAFPLWTPNTHFSGLRLRFAFRRFAKVSARSDM